MRKIVIEKVKHYSKEPIKGRFYYNIVGDNGEVLATSEAFNHQQDLHDTLEEYFPGWEVVDKTIG